MQIDFSRVQRGRGFWKLNNSLLRDAEYKNIVKKCIQNVTLQYATDANLTPEYIAALSPEELQLVPINICPKLFFDTMLLDIRRETIRFASAKKRNQKAEYELNMHLVEELEAKMHNDPNNDVIAEDLNVAKDRLENMHKIIAEGAAVRSRAKY